MWRPQYIRIINLMSHSDSTFNFKEGRVVMIKGQNDYDHEPKSNGAGKSVFIEGLSIAFTGDFIRKVDTPSMIKDGCDSASVEFQMVNSMTSDILHIERTIYRSKTKYASLSIDINGKPVDFAKTAQGDQKILDIIGISKEDLFNYYIISKKKYKSFFYASDGDKRKLISRFSKADIIDGVYSEISDDVKVVDDMIKMLESDKNIISGRMSAYEEQLNGDDEKKSDSELIANLLESIQSKNADIAEANTRIKTSREKLKPIEVEKNIIIKNETKANAKLDAFKPKDYKKDKDKLNKENEVLAKKAEDLEAEVKEGNEYIQEVNDEISKINGKISEIDKKLINFIECPQCSHKFSFKDAKLDINILNTDKLTLENEITAYKNSISESNILIEEISESISDVDLEIDAVNKKIRALETEETKETGLINEIKREISDCKTSISNCTTRVNSINNGIEAVEETIALAKDSISQMQLEISEIKNRDKGIDPKKAIEKKIKDAKKEIVDIDSKILDKNADKASKAKWAELYKRFNVKLSNMAIKSIEGLTNDIQYKMGSNLSLNVEGYKINRDGSVSDQITAHVLRYGLQEGTFFRFSEGEQAKLNLSATMAMQQLINMSCSSGGLDMTFIDEVTESLDSNGIASIVKSFDKINRTIAIITHVSDESVLIPNEITVVKTSEGSKILNK